MPSAQGESVAREELFDEEARRRVEAVAVGPLGHRKNLLGLAETKVVRQEAEVLIIFARTVCEHLHREQRLG